MWHVKHRVSGIALEVRFTEPVVITACEVVELRQSFHCPSLDLKGCTSPESCALEFYVRSGRDSRFQSFGPAFLHSPTATFFLDEKAAVTEHLVLRGSYKSLTLVIYGNLASELCLDKNMDTSSPSRGATFEVDSFLELFRTHVPKVSPLSNLHLITSLPTEERKLLQRLLKCVNGADVTRRLVSMLLTAAASWHLSQQREVKGAQWCIVKKLDQSDSLGNHLDDKFGQDFTELHDLVQQNEVEVKQLDKGNDHVLLHLSERWLQVGLAPICGLLSPLSPVESLVGGLAATQLLCSTRPKDVPAFLAAGGTELLLQVVKEVSGTTSLLLFSLTSVESALRHCCACETFLTKGKEIFHALLEKKQRPPVTLLLQRILQRLQCYELAAAFERLVERLTDSGVVENVDTIKEAAKLLNHLLVALNTKVLDEKTAAEYNWVKRDAELLNSVALEFTSLSLDIDPAVLSVLQEKHFMRAFATFLSVPNIWPANGSATIACIEFGSATQRLLLRLLECRSGLLFLNNDTESLMAVVSSLRTACEQELEVAPLRLVAALSSLGYLCTPRSMAEMVQSRLSMLTAADHLLGADKGSDSAFGAHWRLSAISRSEAGRQAILAIVSFPEVLTSLIEAIHPSPEPAQSVGGAAEHFAAEVLEKVFGDSALTNQLALITYGSSLQAALQAACNNGMSNCSRLVEWVEAAVVYEKKGAVGLLKHAAALIGPQNTGAAMHADGSMDDDGSNLRDRSSGADLPASHSKGLASTLIQDSAVHALTISLKLLASSGWNLEICALLYGEGAMGVVNVILEHCVAALQASSNDFDDEEAEEDEGRGEDQQKERVLLALLSPTLLLLLSLLKCLQRLTLKAMRWKQSLKLPRLLQEGLVYCTTAGQQYSSSRQVDLLVQLHHVVSAKAGAYATDPRYSWTGGVLEVGAVQQVLASLLAFWPLLGWAPALLPRLLGPNSNSVPLEPGEACSVICLLEELLPPECPRLYVDKAAKMDVYRMVAIGTIYGIDVMSAVLWHTSPNLTEKMLQVLYPYLEQIGQLMARLTPCICDVVQERLTILVTRLACQSAEYSAFLVRPVILLLQQRTTLSSKSSLKEADILQVKRMLRWMALLAMHPSSKAVLLQEGAVQVLVQVFLLMATSSTPGFKLGWLFWSCRAVASICDTSVSFLSTASMDRHMSEDCPSFSDCCAIASSLLRLIPVCMIHLEKRTEVLADALEKLASHDVGRTAMASVAFGHAESATPNTNHDSMESEASWVFDKDIPPFLKLWENFATGLESEESLNFVFVRLMRRFADAANALADSGQSLVGLGALKALFGLVVNPENMGPNVTQEQGDNLHSLLRVVSTLQQHMTEIGGASDVSVKSLQEAHKAVSSLLDLLNGPAKGFILPEEIDLLMSRLPAARPIVERRMEAVAARVPETFTLISSITPTEEMELMDVDSSEIGNGDVGGTIPWDCPRQLQERPVMTMNMSKRRVISTVELASKRHRGDGVVNTVASRTTVVVTSSRRDTFRQRKPNTSRPPSMHVDDYVAREKSSDTQPGSLPASTPLQRSHSSVGRPPSIHVDEFMARQRELQQQSAPFIAQGFVENGGSKAGPHFPGGDDGQGSGLTDRNLRVNQTTAEYLSVSVVVSGVTTFSTSAPPALGPMNSAAPPGLSSGPTVQALSGNEPVPLQRIVTSVSTSASEHLNFVSQRNEEVKKEQLNGIASSAADMNIQPPPSPGVKVKLERTASTNVTSAGPPPLPSRFHNPEVIDMGTPVVKEARQQLDRNTNFGKSPAEHPGMPSSSTPQSAPLQQAHHSDMPSNIPPPPPGPPSVWLDPSRRLEPPLLPPAMPVLIPGMNVGTYNHGQGSRPPADLQVGGVVLQPPAGLWRETPPTFTSLPPPTPPAPGPIQHGPAFVQQLFVSVSRPLDTLQSYPTTQAGTSSRSHFGFGTFGGPPPVQGQSPPFQPPIPTGMPPIQNPHQIQQPVHHPPPVHIQEADVTAQQEPGAVLQQILASPDTIQELLKDPKKLQQLLEQHPKLVTLLQEKMKHGML